MAAHKAIQSSKVKGKPGEKRVYFKQADFPLVSLQQAQRIASALMDNFGGREGSPPDIALAMGVSPTSSAWPPLAGSAVAYGITEGGVNANTITLTPLGRRLVAPEAEGDDLTARREAIFRPRLMKEFFEKYRRAKFPNDVIAENVLKGLGIPVERVKTALEVLKANGKYAGIIRDTPTGPFVNLDSPGIPAPASTLGLHDVGETAAEPPEERKEARAATAPIQATTAPTFDAKANKVFITHGKQKGDCCPDQRTACFRRFRPSSINRT
jgi:hypothetical protein